MVEPNNFPIGILLLIIVALTALGYLLLAYSINIWPFASKPTCDNIDGNGNPFTCSPTGGTRKSGVTCATSPCTEEECCTDSVLPTPPPPPPPTPPSAVCQKTTQGGDGWNAIKDCDNADCENRKECSAGGKGTRQCYRWVDNSCKQVANPVQACYDEDEDKNIKNYDDCSTKSDKESCESCVTATLDCCEPVSTESFRRR